MKRSELLVPIAVLIANASGVAISFVVPAFLQPAQYSTFALALAVGQVLVGLFFEWMRIPALRFTVGPDPALAVERSKLIAAIYRWIAGVLIALVIVSLALGAWVNVGIVPVALVFALCQGTFDGRQAFLRARRWNIAFARNWTSRALLSIALAVAAAWLTDNGSITVIALGSSFLMVLAIGMAIDLSKHREPVPPTASFSFKRWPELRMLTRYGVLAAGSSVIILAIPTIIRGALVDQVGRNAAAGSLVSIDIAIKALAVTGVMVNVVAMQNSFTAVDEGNVEGVWQASRQQMVWVLGTIVPIGLVLYLVREQAASVLLRPAYRTTFVQGIGFSIVASALMYVRSFAVDPLFLAFHRAGLAVLGAATSLAVCGLAVLLPWADPALRIDPFEIYVASAASGLLVASFLAIVTLKMRLPWVEMVRMAFALAAVSLASRYVPHGAGIAGLVVSGGLLGLTYVVAALVFDVAGVRSSLYPFAVRLGESCKDLRRQ